jgi:hypothetical protein
VYCRWSQKQFGVNRLKTMAEFISATGFSDHAQRLVQNTQQYYSGEQKYKIAGGLLDGMNNGAKQNFLSVNPTSISGFFDFVPVDGTLPVDRLALANLWKESCWCSHYRGIAIRIIRHEF